MSLEIKPLAEADLVAADRILRLAFGRFLGLPDEVALSGDADFVNTRWRAAPACASAVSRVPEKTSLRIERPRTSLGLEQRGWVALGDVTARDRFAPWLDRCSITGCWQHASSFRGARRSTHRSS